MLPSFYTLYQHLRYLKLLAIREFVVNRVDFIAQIPHVVAQQFVVALPLPARNKTLVELVERVKLLHFKSVDVVFNVCGKHGQIAAVVVNALPQSGSVDVVNTHHRRYCNARSDKPLKIEFEFGFCRRHLSLPQFKCFARQACADIRRN